ncbi:MAG: heat-shock protein Hsp20 [Meiothermus sp.]
MLDIAKKQNVQPVPFRSWNLTNLGNVNDLFSEFDRLWGELSAPLSGQFRWAASYPVDLYETGDSVVLEMAVPGIRKEDLDISIEGNLLTIRGRYPEISDGEERRYWVQGMPHGAFSRSVSLPASVEVDEVKATVKDGLLTLTLPKVAGARVRKIAIAQS